MTTDRTAVHRLLAAALALLVLPVLLAAPALGQDDGLVGTVVGPDGEPVEDARVAAVRVDEPDAVVGRAATDGEGAWTLALADGSYLLHATPPAGGLADVWFADADAVAEADVVEVAGGSGPDDLVLRLPEGGALGGTVRGFDGPVGDATVRVRRTPFHSVEVTTDGAGAFRLEGLPAGPQTVEVEPASANLSSAEQVVDIDPGTVAEVQFVLRPRPTGVERVAGRDRVATAVEASKRGFLTAPTVVIAGAGSFPDALAAAPLAATVGGPLLLVGPRLTPVVVDELRRLGATEAVVVGSLGVVPLIVQEELRRLGLEVRRIAGENRFDTAALIARDVGAPDGRVIVAGGGSFADALSVAPLAAAERIPILLTGADALHPDAAAALRALGATETLVVGGTGVVGDAVLAALPDATRVSGRTRYETSLAIARHWAEGDMRLDTVHVATGRDFPDALAAGPVAALARGPLLLVDGRDPAVPAETYAWLAERRDDIVGAYAFGGDGVMVDPVLDRLRQAIGARS